MSLCLHLAPKVKTLATDHFGDVVLEEIGHILQHFETGRVLRCEPIKSGLMHATYKVETSTEELILQRLHHKLSSREILNDYVRVTRHLQQKGLCAPKVYPTRNGDYVFVDEQHAWWRMTTYVSGETHERVSSVGQAKEGAKILGSFHLGMQDFPFDFESTHPLHDTDGHLSGLSEALRNPAYKNHWSSVSKAAEQINELMRDVRLPSSLPLKVVHGDPKISNVMFKDEQAVGMIDLDTCNRHTVLVDLGDAIRSWCRDGYEDEVQQFHLDRFEGILCGYVDSGAQLTEIEINSLWMAGPMITLELASRFARDVLEDHYFAFDPSQYNDRRTHNLARMKSMLFLAQDMISKKDEMNKLIEKYFSPTI